MTDYFDRLVERTLASADAVTPVRRLEPDDLGGPAVVDDDQESLGPTERGEAPGWSHELDERRDVGVADRWSASEPGEHIQAHPPGPGPEASTPDRRLVEPSDSSDHRPSPPRAGDEHLEPPPPVVDPVGEPVMDDPQPVVEVTPSPSPAAPAAPDARPADPTKEDPAAPESMPDDTPGLAEMDRVLFAQAGLAPPWEDDHADEPADPSTDQPETAVVPPSETQPPAPDRSEPVSYVEHVPVPGPEPSTAPVPAEPAVSIGSVRIEIVEPPAASPPSGRGVPRARAHLGSSRSQRRAWGW